MSPRHKMCVTLYSILSQAQEQFPDFSDIILSAGNPVQVETDGELRQLKPGVKFD